jgi:hypothetical protein
MAFINIAARLDLPKISGPCPLKEGKEMVLLNTGSENLNYQDYEKWKFHTRLSKGWKKMRKLPANSMK